MLHFQPNYFFPAENQYSWKRLRSQTERMFTHTYEKHAMLHWCNILRYPHRQNASQPYENASGETIAKKTEITSHSHAIRSLCTSL